jgi:hypothetical protein
MATVRGVLRRVPSYIWWVFLLEGMTAILLYLMLVMMRSF